MPRSWRTWTWTFSTGLDAFPALIALLVSGHWCDRLGYARRPHGARAQEFIPLLQPLLRGPGAGFSDAQCGFKAVRADVAKLLLPLVMDNGWFFDTEMLVLLVAPACASPRWPLIGWTPVPRSASATPSRRTKGAWRISTGLLAGRIPLGQPGPSWARRPGRHGRRRALVPPGAFRRQSGCFPPWPICCSSCSCADRCSSGGQLRCPADHRRGQHRRQPLVHLSAWPLRHRHPAPAGLLPSSSSAGRSQQGHRPGARGRQHGALEAIAVVVVANLLNDLREVCAFRHWATPGRHRHRRRPRRWSRRRLRLRRLGERGSHRHRAYRHDRRGGDRMSASPPAGVGHS